MVIAVRYKLSGKGVIPMGFFGGSNPTLDMEIKIAEDRKEISSLKHRMKDVEVQTETIHNLASSVNRLATNIENLSKTQMDVLARLKKLEQEPLETMKYYKKTIISCILTGVLSALLGAVLALIL